MALWKPLRGNRSALDAVEKHDGYIYFCIDDGSLFFDYTDADGTLQRKQISAQDLTVADWAKEATKPSYTASEVGALPLSGGVMTGEITIGQGDGKGIQLGTNGRINATVGSNTAATMFGVSNGVYYLGHNGFSTTIRGSANRPTYNGKDMALYSDVPSVPAWAKEATKPTYTAEEVGALPNTTVIPNVPSWALAETKPTYTAAEVGALPSTTTIPTVNNATLTIQKNGTDVATFTANSASNATANITVPTKTSELTNDSGFKTTDNNTTYTFASGTTKGAFSVTPSGGSAQSVSVYGLSAVATSGSYNDLSNKPTIPNVGSGTDYTTYRARSIALKTTAETPANGCLLGVYS